MLKAHSNSLRKEISNIEEDMYENCENEADKDDLYY